MALQVIINQTPTSPSELTSPHPSLRPNRFPFVKWLLGIFSSYSLLILISIGIVYFLEPSVISPLSETRKILGFGDIVEKPNKIVYGFLPYWNFKYIDELDLRFLTHLAIFGLSFEADGSIRTRELNYMEPGWRNLTSDQAQQLINQAQANNILVTVALTAFDNESIENIISNESATQTMIEEVITFVKTYQLDGINIDFEYVGTPKTETQKAFTRMVEKLTTAVKAANPDYHVSIDVYADSAKNNRIWELEPIGQIVDHIIIMAYDFHRPASSVAGPVAPIFGAGEGWSQDIVTLLNEHMLVNPPAKLILGVPFYGYEWRTLDQSYLSQTYTGTGRLATYRRVKTLLEEKPETAVNWNNQALSPWISYSEEDITYQIQYDDIRSLGFKYDLVNQTNMAGIGIWALGYEGTNPEVWTLIHDKF